ncbi:MAG: putative endonuclease, partial [Patiriisocius sp.]
MAAHNDLGILGEALALKHLLEKEYIILERNWTFQKAEIDIIAQKDDQI